MKTLYFDCFSGISGDMVLGAFLDLGVEEEYLKQELKKLHLDHYDIHGIKTKKMDISGTHCHIDAKEEHMHRHFSEIRQMIEDSELEDKVKQTAIAIFRRVAEAEGRVHGVPADYVHFHEVGALDSIIDIVGAAICFHKIAPEKVYVSGINVGSGWVRCAHGMIPVPAPAVVEIMTDAQIPMYSKWIEQECATPTGVAIVAELAQYAAQMPSLVPEKVAYGFGKKDFQIPNGLRLILGDLEMKPEGHSDKTLPKIEEVSGTGRNAGEHSRNEEIIVIETNIDDGTGEMAGYAMEQLLKAGALDVFYTPIYMKKNRPAMMLTVLAKEENCSILENIIFRETPTIGIRKYRTERTCMTRKMRKVDTPYGVITVKSCSYGEINKETLEYDEVARIAREHQIPYGDVVAELTKLISE